MADRVSPGRTVQVAAGLAAACRAAEGTAAEVGALRVAAGWLAGAGRVLPGALAGVVPVLLAVLAFAWAAGPIRAVTARRGTRMLQASAVHADLVHLRTVVLLSFRNGSAPDAAARRRRAWAWGRKGTRPGGPPARTCARRA